MLFGVLNYFYEDHLRKLVRVVVKEQEPQSTYTKPELIPWVEKNCLQFDK